MIERRKKPKASPVTAPSASLKMRALPADFLRQVTDVFGRSFAEPLKLLSKDIPGAGFEASGEVFGDEVVLGMSVVAKKRLSATSVFASVDFDPLASSPTLEELMAACVDAVGSVFNELFSRKDSAVFLAETLLDAKDIPFHWTETESNKIRVFVRLDKSHPNLEAAADRFLEEHGGIPDADEDEALEDDEEGPPPGETVH